MELGRKTVSGIMLTLLITSMFAVAYRIQQVRAEPKTWIVDDDGSADFHTIQEAVNAASPGDTVYVHNGTYNENVVVNKTISLIGNDKTSTIISAHADGHTVLINADDVTVSNFTIQNARGYYGSGVDLSWPSGQPPWSPSNATIRDNIIQNNTVGVLIYGSNNTIVGNIIAQNEEGISIKSSYNSIEGNEVADNFFGIWLESNHNSLQDNKMHSNNFNLIQNLLNYLWPLDNNIDSSNTINGKPVYYLVGQANLEISPQTFPEIGYLALINSYNITVRDLLLSNNGQGILLQNCSNVTLEANMMENNIIGVQVTGSSFTTILQNTIRSNYHGLGLHGGNQNRVEGNTITGNTFKLSPRSWPDWLATPFLAWMLVEGFLEFSGGIFLWSNNNTLANNIVLNNEYGVQLYASSFNVFRDNSMSGNSYNFGFMDGLLFPPTWNYDPQKPQISPYLLNDIDTSNTVDNKPIYYWINHNNEQVPSDAGYVALINCTNIIVKDLTMHNNNQGIFLFETTGTIISNNSITNTKYGVKARGYTFLDRPVNITVKENSITKNGVGIEIAIGNQYTISNNSLRGNLAGIYVLTDNNTITHNNIMNSTLPRREEWILGGYLPNHWVYLLERHWGSVGMIIEATNNTVFYNTFQFNDFHLSIGQWIRKGGNIIHHNNFLQPIEAHFEGSIHPHPPFPKNIWDDGYPSGGNYWSEYNGADFYKGPFQNVTGSDGIGDNSYSVCINNIDRYPLIHPYGYIPSPDLNGDKHVDGKDIAAAAKAFGSCPSRPRWNFQADLNQDSRIDGKDLATVAKNFGKTYT
jgi:parallel beta-helix repeat protein